MGQSHAASSRAPPWLRRAPAGPRVPTEPSVCTVAWRPGGAEHLSQVSSDPPSACFDGSQALLDPVLTMCLAVRSQSSEFERAAGRGPRRGYVCSATAFQSLSSSTSSSTSPGACRTQSRPSDFPVMTGHTERGHLSGQPSATPSSFHPTVTHSPIAQPSRPPIHSSSIPRVPALVPGSAPRTKK